MKHIFQRIELGVDFCYLFQQLPHFQFIQFSIERYIDRFIKVSDDLVSDNCLLISLAIMTLCIINYDFSKTLLILFKISHFRAAQRTAGGRRPLLKICHASRNDET